MFGKQIKDESKISSYCSASFTQLIIFLNYSTSCGVSFNIALIWLGFDEIS
ncbi:hypothetical protein wTpre_149 [Wolbachia endosymbiont of Trichogramma pretiosum]|nr:hypothetical protein wTpre_149 [Wolbachia endosymbiont of Trichogramma pretiosum]